MTYWLYLDDVRMPGTERPHAGRPTDGSTWVIARTYQEAVKIFDEKGPPAYVAFDHDLGILSEGDGPKFVDFLIDFDIASPWMEKNNFQYSCHSANPMGKERILDSLDRYMKYLKK